MGTLIAGVGMVLLVVLLLGYPFFRRHEEEAPLSLEVNEDELEEGKERVFTALRELEYDYQMNKISEEDYHEVKEELTAQAAHLIKQEELLTGERLMDDVTDEAAAERIAREIEEEIAREIGRSRGAGTTTEAAKDTEGEERQGARFCPHCGAALYLSGQRFCHSCGGKLG